MLFDVFIPYGNHLEHFPITLMSIATQTCRDFQVTVADDGTKEGAEVKALCEEFSKFMPNPIKYIRFDENKGIAVQRQRLLDTATAEYFTSCDSDDAFYHCEVLETFKKNIEIYRPQNKLPDILHMSFIEAHDNGARIAHQPMDNAWQHGKMFRVQFLKDNKIFYDPAVELYEDGKFVQWASKLANFQVQIPDSGYFWTHTAGSIVRSGEYIHKMLSFFCDSFWRNYKAIEPLKGRDNCADLLFSGLVMPYYYLMGLERRYPEDDANIAKTYAVLKDMIESSHIIDLINTDERYFNGFNQVLRQGIQGVLNQDPYFVGGGSINDWLKLHFGVSIKKLEPDALQGIRDPGTATSMYSDRITKEKSSDTLPSTKTSN